jgi:uncharacterized protein YbjT (DUF2867 family)
MTDLILVTGATGTVGTEVVRQLVQSGQDVRVLVRDAARAPDGVDVAVGDLTQPRTLTRHSTACRKRLCWRPSLSQMRKRWR